VTLEQDFPQDITSEFAEYGTAGHTLGEMCLTQEVPAKTFRGEILNKSEHFPDGFEVDDEMIDAVQTYIDYCNQLPGDEGSRIEEKVDFSEWVPDGFGTADFIKIDDDVLGKRTIQVVDLKMGKGVKVNAENNPQGMLYALGCLDELIYDPEDFVRIVIVQPRLDHISEWDISINDLLEWAEKVVKKKAGEAWAGLMKFSPGEKQCRFCKASSTCKALAEKSLQTAMDVFTDIPTTGDLKQIHTLGNSEVSQLLPRLDEISNWIKSLKAFAFSQLEQGFEIDGYKLVRGRSGNRKWINESAVEEKMETLGFHKDNLYKQVIITPAVAQRMLKAQNISITQISNLYNQEEGKPTITDRRDPREEIISNDGSEFDVID
jgi:hypothetical protein|tara:strand:- start:5760 stop:6887 length:1128 start_codon:yes stop_codon:yes gene_type:complete